MNEMNEKEINEWIKKAIDFQTLRAEYDQNGNYELSVIYEYENKFYILEFMNGHPCEMWGEKGYKRGCYLPQEVIKKERTIIETYYETLDGKET